MVETLRSNWDIHWLVLVIWFAILFFVEVLHNRKHPHHDARAALQLTILMIVGGFSYVFVVWGLKGGEAAQQFMAGYLTEKALSIDNLFVFLLLFRQYGIREEQQHIVLAWGIAGALIFRAIFVALGAPIVQNFEWVLWIFGFILTKNGIKALQGEEEEEDVLESRAVKFIRKIFPVAKTLKKTEQNKLLVWRSGLAFTALATMIPLVESTDIVFAVDSVPAVFSLTRDPYIVYSSNMFAILGLRALFFLLEPVLANLKYMKIAMGCILIFIGVKMIVPALFVGPEVIATQVFGVANFLSGLTGHSFGLIVPEWLNWPAHVLPTGVLNFLHSFLTEDFQLATPISLSVLVTIISIAVVASFIDKPKAEEIEIPA